MWMNTQRITKKKTLGLKYSQPKFRHSMPFLHNPVAQYNIGVYFKKKIVILL